MLKTLLIGLPLFLILLTYFLVLVLNILERLLDNDKEYVLENNVQYDLLYIVTLFIPIVNLYIACCTYIDIIKLIIKTIKNGFTSKN